MSDNATDSADNSVAAPGSTTDPDLSPFLSVTARLDFWSSASEYMEASDRDSPFSEVRFDPDVLPSAMVAKFNIWGVFEFK